jgi:hypothetical protein
MLSNSCIILNYHKNIKTVFLLQNKRVVCFLGAISRYPLYSLLKKSGDAAAIGAKRFRIYLKYLATLYSKKE